MFNSNELKKHLETSSAVRTQSAIIAEWNMNIPNNIQKIGNYRYRPATSDSPFKTLINSYDKNDAANAYTKATDADVVIDGGFEDEDMIPIVLKETKDKIKMLYSLEDCFGPLRPRSGINKASFFSGSYLHHANLNMAKRPRYYMPDKDDGFKYWTSYRTENGKEYGISSAQSNGSYFIEDAAPFIVYKELVPTNRIVVKMQTHIGTIDLGPFSNSSSTFSDPLYGQTNAKIPTKWKIQKMINNNWSDIISFDSNSRRKDGNPIIGPDGYVEISYGLKIPSKYSEIFIYAEEYDSELFLPDEAVTGYAYLIKADKEDVGTYYIWYNGQWETFTPSYGWQLQEETVDRLTNFVTDLTDPVMFQDNADSKIKYREFEYIQGLRVVTEKMNVANASFDLIELSPRLSVNLSNQTKSFSITKSASDLGISGMPVGQLLASTGSLTIFDIDDAFNLNNTKSIVHNYLTRNIQFKFYEVIVDVAGYDYYIPIKTLYSEGFPKIDHSSKKVSLELRDMFFRFESMTAPQMLTTNTSVSSAVSLLLDSVGFSNYAFKRLPNEPELIIPYFFIPPNKTVAEVLQDLAISTQTAMFFDEYNNFVMMSRNYIMPSLNDRATDIGVYGVDDQADTGVLENETTRSVLSNIIGVASHDNSVYNGGTITYDVRYIQRSVGSIKQASMIDNDKVWVYKPVLLWEVSGSENTKSINQEVGAQSSYVLSAIPMNSSLSDAVPTVSNHVVINNVIDLGEGVYWIPRYNGYFYANGEIIKFDAVEYNVAGVGNVWINGVEEYQNYFSKLPFNGKIYPTGLVRIYSEPNYEVINGVTRLANGPVAKHGRGQFNTKVVSHDAGVNEYWTNDNNVRGCVMDSDLLFNSVKVTADGKDYQTAKTSGLTTLKEFTFELEDGPAGISLDTAKKSSRNGIIKNFLSSSYKNENDVKSLLSTQSGTIQSSALVFNGPTFNTAETSSNYISYVYKKLTDSYKSFGTRIRIVGKIESNKDKTQSMVGGSQYYTVTGLTPDTDIYVTGGSGGIAVLLNPETNNGYYFEIAALSTYKVDSKNTNVNNIFFYKIAKEVGSSDSDKAIPIKLWEGLTNIVVDDGRFTGQYRMVAEQTPTVYDLNVEYEKTSSGLRFYLFINGNQVAVVDDTSPLPVYSNMALFVRGSAKCMFEHIYAITNNYTQNTAYSIDTPVNKIYADKEIDANAAFSKYAMSGVVQGTYLSGISPYQPPEHRMYFDEFGTIMREAALFDVKYDKAWPALFAKMSPTFNRLKGYTVSGFRAGSYGAEFMVFNATDTALSLDETTGNYLRIQGITFTQNSQNDLTVDSYFSKNSDFSNPELSGTTVLVSPEKTKQEYQDIKISRMTHGKKEFSLNVPYIQTQDDANSLMGWMIKKIMKPRQSIGLQIFANPMIQLGDIVEVSYVKDNIDILGSLDKRFVVYNIEYSKDESGPSMSLYVSEVL